MRAPACARYSISWGTGRSAMGAGQGNIYERDLDRNPANYQPLTPLSLLEWAESTYPDKTAVIHGARSYTYREFGARCRRLASALAKRALTDFRASRTSWRLKCRKRDSCSPKARITACEPMTSWIAADTFAS